MKLTVSEERVPKSLVLNIQIELEMAPLKRAITYLKNFCRKYKFK